MTIKILYHLNQVGYGGTEKAILTFCENLDKNRFTPYLFIHENSGRLRYYKHLLLRHVPSKYDQRFQILYKQSRARLEDFLNTLGHDKVFIGRTNSFQQIVKTISPDIVHFNRGKWEAYYEEFLDKIPNTTACIETNIFGYPASEQYINRLNRLYFVSNWLLTKSDWCKDKCHVLYNPIKKPSNNNTVRQQFNISDDAFVFGRISRPDLADDSFILDVFARIKQKHPNTFLIILAGSEIMREAARNNPSIKLIDATTDENILSNFYNSIDVLLHYRIDGETFGMNIAEAMIHGKPVISHLSHIDNAQAELLENTGKHGEVGFVAQQHDMDEYINYMTALISNPKKTKTMGSNARQRALALFSEDTVTRYLENEYEKIISSR